MVYFKNKEQKSFNEEKEGQFDVNFTNNKGFYLYLTKMLGLITDFRLENDYDMWIKTLDSLYINTYAFWKNTKELEEFETKYQETKRILFNNKGKNENILRLVEEKLRFMNILIVNNISHLMIKLNTSSDDEDFFKELEQSENI